MATPYSLSVREEVVRRLLSKESQASVATELKVSKNTIWKWWVLYCRARSIPPPEKRGPAERSLAPASRLVPGAGVERSGATPSSAFHEAELAERGVKVSESAVMDFFQAEGLRYKRTLVGQE